MKRTKLLVLSLFLVGLASVLADTPPAAPAPAPVQRTPTQYESMVIFQRDEATKALQNAQIEIAMRDLQIQTLQAQVSDLKKQLDAAKTPTKDEAKK